MNLMIVPEPPPGKTGWPWTEVPEPLPSTMPDGSLWPKISVVTPSFNQGQFIEETIRSILLQGYPNLEFIIIDGGSTDNTIEVIKKYEPWLAYWVSEPDRGQSHAINKGLKKATGQLLAWLNSDDLYMPESLKIIGQLYVASRSSKIFIGACSICDENLQEKFVKEPRHLCFEELLGGKDSVGQPSVFFTSDILDESGLLDESMFYMLDKDLWIRFSKIIPEESQVLIEQVLSIARVWIGNKSSFGAGRTKGSTQQLASDERFYMLDKYLNNKNYSSQLDHVSKYYYSKAYYRKANFEARIGKYWDFRKSLIKAFWLNPKSMNYSDFFTLLFSREQPKSKPILNKKLAVKKIKKIYKRVFPLSIKKNRKTEVPIDQLRCQNKPFSEVLGFSNKPVEFFPPFHFFEISLTDPETAFNDFSNWLRMCLIGLNGWKVSKREGGLQGGSLYRLIVRLHKEKGITLDDFLDSEPEIIEEAISQRVDYYFDLLRKVRENDLSYQEGNPIYCYPKNEEGFFEIYDGHHRVCALKLTGFQDIEVEIWEGNRND